MRGLFAFLSRASPAPAPGSRADAIFVFAGSHARKEFGAAAWRRGDAPILVVSVGRFEWRRYVGLGLAGDDALRAAVDRTPATERHFFVIVGSGGSGESGESAGSVGSGSAEAIPVPMRRFGTRNEARALGRLARERGWRDVIVISSAFHLRRVALVVGRALRGSGVRAAYAALPDAVDPHGASRWWHTARGVRNVLSEVVKLAVYRVFLAP